MPIYMQYDGIDAPVSTADTADRVFVGTGSRGETAAASAGGGIGKMKYDVMSCATGLVPIVDGIGDGDEPVADTLPPPRAGYLKIKKLNS